MVEVRPGDTKRLPVSGSFFIKVGTGVIGNAPGIKFSASRNLRLGYLSSSCESSFGALLSRPMLFVTACRVLEDT